MVKRLELPPEMREAQFIVEVGVSISLGDLDDMPVSLAEKVALYRAVKNAKLATD